jgi:outer membrane receptor protein involved in Fe transport
MTTYATFVSGTRVNPLNLAAIIAFQMFVGGAALATDATGPAQSADATAQSGPEEGQAVEQLSQIVVTASRHAQPLSKVPISVEAMSQKTMDDLHISTFADLVSHVPGVSLQTAHSGVQGDLAVRGIFSGGNAPTTEVYVDETPISVRVVKGAGPQGSPYPNIFDLDRVEVLRGPQGTLFGSSAMGGAIRYITPQPNLISSSGLAKMDIGYTDGGAPTYDMGVAYGAPISPGVAGFRVSVWGRSASGWIPRVDPFSGMILNPDANSSASYVIRPAFTIVPVEGLTITPAVFIQHIHEDNPDTYWTTFVPQANQGTRVSGSIEEPSTDDLRVPSLSIRYDFAKVSFESNSSYLDRHYHDVYDYTHTIEAVYSGTPFIPGLESFHSPFLDVEFNRAWQQEFRLTSSTPNSRLSWVVGAYYRNALAGDTQLIPPALDAITEAIAGEDSLEYTGIPTYFVNGLALNSFTNFQARDVSKALFGEITVVPVAGLKVNAGVRFEHSLVTDQHEIVAGPLNGVAYSDVVLPPQVGNPITPRVGVTYQINDKDMVYATAAKGYRSGGGNANDSIGNPLCLPSLEELGLTDVPKSFNSDSLWSYEVGTKDSMFDNRLAFQLSAYDIIWSNIQSAVSLPSCSEGFTANRGKAISRGVDLQVQALVGEHLQLSLSGGYDHAYYPTAEYGAPSKGVTPLLVDSGEALPSVVPWSVAVTANYSRSIDRLWQGANSYLRLDYRQLSAIPSLDPRVAGYDPKVGPHQDEGYGVLNLRLGVTRGGLDLSAYALNATNSDPLLGYTHGTKSSPLFMAAAIRPVTVGVTAMYAF